MTSSPETLPSAAATITTTGGHISIAPDSGPIIATTDTGGPITIKPDSAPIIAVNELRCHVADTIEDLGSLLTLLREATDELIDSRQSAAAMTLEDASSLYRDLETSFTNLAARHHRILNTLDADLPF